VRTKKAILAVAASMLTTAYYVLKDDVMYPDLGADYFEYRDKAQVARRLVRRLEALGLFVEARGQANRVTSIRFFLETRAPVARS
jgi:hypothetical protein